MRTTTEYTTESLAELVDLTGKTAIVTGGAIGIGQSIAQRLHEAGAALVIADLDGPEAGLVADRLDSHRSHSALAIQTDVSVTTDVETMVNAAVRQFGSVDILVNNAGIYPFSSFVEMDAGLFEHAVRVNLIGPFLAMQAAARQMIAQGHGGKIINVSSIDALHPSMVRPAHYDASTHGLWGLTRNIALELAAYGIAVNALAPGGVHTPGRGAAAGPDAVRQTLDRIPLHRMADPDEMGRAALFLASDLSSYLVGSHIVADGGLLLR
jgi:2-dehydro-3-deoxy-D-gluconate 5-dehydrogenase